MPNDFFCFKHFTVQQQHCAMKVCTDACLFGAWVAGKIVHDKLKCDHILDIGAGTGVLSLMLAQQLSNSVIAAIEIDAPAATQAATNFTASPWRKQLHVFNNSIQLFSSAKQYDFIISNPPFFSKRFGK